jgi:hypothetical protein
MSSISTYETCWEMGRRKRSSPPLSMKHWTCSRTRLVLEQVSKKRGFLNKIHVFYRFLSGSCLETEVSEQLYYEKRLGELTVPRA